MASRLGSFAALPCRVAALSFVFLVCLGSAAGAELLPARSAVAEPPKASPPANAPIEAVIDFYVDRRLADEKVRPALQIGDENLVRRVSLDLLGRIPTPREVREYVADKNPNKRTLLVERALASPEYVQHQVNEFETLLMAGGGGSIREYLQEALAERRTWDRMFRELMLGVGDDPKKNKAQDFLKSRVKDADRLTNDVSSLFFGVNISCAQCHDHPLADDWKQEHFYGLKSFFNRTFENGGFVGERDYGDVSFQTPAGQQRQAKLMFLSGRVIDEPTAKEPSNDDKKKETELFRKLAEKKEPPPRPKFSRRAQLVETVLAKSSAGGEQQMFARAIVNRLWHRYFGYGLVMPVDQMHSGNPPSHPELLDHLARDFAAHGFDMHRLVRGMLLSKTYSRGSRWEGDGSRPDAWLFAVANVRPLTPQQLAASLRTATIDPASVEGIAKPEDFAKRMAGLSASARGWGEYFQPTDDDFQVSVTETLMFSNHQRVVAELLSDGSDRLIGALKKLDSPEKVAETAVWSVWSRKPDEEERRMLVEYLARRTDRQVEGLRQMVWALLASAEFRFNY